MHAFARLSVPSTNDFPKLSDLNETGQTEWVRNVHETSPLLHQTLGRRSKSADEAGVHEHARALFAPFLAHFALKRIVWTRPMLSNASDGSTRRM